MTLPTLIVLTPLLGALMPPLAQRWGRNGCAAAAAAPSALALVLLLYLAPAIHAGDKVAFRAEWIPQLGITLSFFIDGLSLFFAALILGMGLLVILYARFYLREEDSLGRFYGYLLLFQGAMLGIVLSDNILVLLVFWELTSLSSFLLIGYWHTRAESRQGARMALIVTGGGGLALLAGMLVLGEIAGSYELSEIITRGEAIRSSPLLPLALGLILVGAFTKSAQFPFHFWLPHAMAAPTPVSAYLHSATMVKAGVFLLARLWPVFAGTEIWFVLLTGTGLLTALVAAWIALFKNDLKQLLAYSTVSQLGVLVMLLGFGTPAAAIAAVFHILNHALFKAALFMSAGIVDHEAGTRDMTRLGGLAHVMPLSAILAIIAAAAMAGVPLLNGFVSKEMILEQASRTVYAGVPWLLPFFATVSALLSAAYSARLVFCVYFGHTRYPAGHKPHDPPLGLWLPVALLAAPVVVIGIYPALVQATVTQAAASVTGVALAPVKLVLWHGFTPALAMSVLALLGGLALVSVLARVDRWRSVWPRPEAKQIYDRIVATLVSAARWGIARSHADDLPRYVTMMLVAILAVGALGFLGAEHAAGTRPHLAWSSAAIVGWLVLAAACAVALARHHDRLLLLIVTGVAGLIVSLTFALFSAPDLALTQISVEIVAVILVLLALNAMPKRTPKETGRIKRTFDGLIAGCAGMATAALSFAVLTRGFDPISSYHLAQAKPAGGGNNVVNIILVDFRGFDTFGEIIVLGIAGITIVALLDTVMNQRTAPAPMPADDAHPLILMVGTRLLLPLVLTAALYILLRGHNLPGGGFIAGVVVAIAFIMQYVASGYEWSRQQSRLDPHFMIGGGILLAGLTGIGSWLVGFPFLTSAHGQLSVPVLGSIEITSVLAFDLGVFATVVGAVLISLATLSRVEVRGREPAVEIEPKAIARPPQRRAPRVAQTLPRFEERA